MTKYLIVIILVLFISCNSREGGKTIENILEGMPEKFTPVISNPDKYHLQILYTQIDRDQDNQSAFSTYSYRVNAEDYFYPASTVKLPAAVLALEKLNQLKIPDLTKNSTMLTDSAFSGQSSVLYDSSAQSKMPSIEHYIKKIFLVSDNDAFNRIYEFLGQEYLNESLQSKGFGDTEIIHRLSIYLSQEENKQTNPIRFYEADKLLYNQKETVSNYNNTKLESILLGKGYISGDSLVNKPMDFNGKNEFSLENLHQILIETLFPGKLTGQKLFNLEVDDYEFLYTYMSMYPGESSYPDYALEYDDNYVKFFLFGDNSNPIPENIRIFNKVGMAYGFLIDAAYIVDFEMQIEFFLTAVIYVNENQVFGDNQYEYDSLGIAFLAELGRKVYEYELIRKRNYLPDLKRFKLDY